MRILAVETATIEVGVAIADEGGPLATVTARPGRRQAETLHPAIADVCRIAGVALSELDGIAVDIGPGLFTGLRVGVAAAKALAGALGVRVVTAVSLEILAAACPTGLAAVVPVVDMRRGEVAWLLPGDPPASPHLGTAGDLAADIAVRLTGLDAAGARPLLFVGDGALRHRDQLAGSLRPRPSFAGTELAAPPVSSLAVLAIQSMANGSSLDPADVRPLYGREADARINWSSRSAVG
jgi:tRNA threonylcarbamoyladenosine biosynthesis protein TsaB